MREILFRAKRISDGEWAEGYYFYNANIKKHYIKTWICYYEINPETVCQFTGLHDKNGRKIWENDIVSEDFSNYKGVIRFSEFESLELKNVGFNIEWYGGIYYRQDLTYWADKCEIIGSAIDNPELLKGCL